MNSKVPTHVLLNIIIDSVTVCKLSCMVFKIFCLPLTLLQVVGFFQEITRIWVILNWISCSRLFCVTRWLSPNSRFGNRTLSVIGSRTITILSAQEKFSIRPVRDWSGLLRLIYTRLRLNHFVGYITTESASISNKILNGRSRDISRG